VGIMNKQVSKKNQFGLSVPPIVYRQFAVTIHISTIRFHGLCNDTSAVKIPIRMTA